MADSNMVAGTNGFNTPQRIFNQVIDFGSKWMTGSTAKKTEVADEPPAQVSNDASHESLMALVTQSRARDSPETMFHGGLIPPLYLHLVAIYGRKCNNTSLLGRSVIFL